MKLKIGISGDSLVLRITNLCRVNNYKAGDVLEIKSISKVKKKITNEEIIKEVWNTDFKEMDENISYYEGINVMLRKAIELTETRMKNQIWELQEQVEFLSDKLNNKNKEFAEMIDKVLPLCRICKENIKNNCSNIMCRKNKELKQSLNSQEEIDASKVCEELPSKKNACSDTSNSNLLKSANIYQNSSSQIQGCGKLFYDKHNVSQICGWKTGINRDTGILFCPECQKKAEVKK